MNSVARSSPARNDNKENEQTTLITKQPKDRPAKRGPPSTPLTPSLQQPHRIRRKLAAAVPKRTLISSGDSAEMLESKYQMWLLRSELDKSKELVRFLELERKFTHESETV